MNKKLFIGLTILILISVFVSSDTSFLSKDTEIIKTTSKYEITKITETYEKDSKIETKLSYETVNLDISKDKQPYKLQTIVADIIALKPTTTTTSTTTTTKTEITKPISTTTTTLGGIIR